MWLDLVGRALTQIKVADAVAMLGDHVRSALIGFMALGLVGIRAGQDACQAGDELDAKAQRLERLAK